MAKAKTFVTRPSAGLWGAIRITAWIFIVLSVLVAAAYGWRAILLSRMDPMQPMGEFDPVPGHEDESLMVGFLSLPFIVVFLVGALLTLRWYLRSIRNAHVLHRGITISPAWVVWFFILPIVSLIRPYTMTSELWRASHQPEGWKALGDPALLRWWWGLVLTSNFVSVGVSLIARGASTAGDLMIGDALSAVGNLLAALSGVLFLRIGGPISRLQTALIAAGHRPPAATVPAWAD